MFLRVIPDTPEVHLPVLAIMVRIGVAASPHFLKSRQPLLFRYEATYRFAYATTRKIAHLPNGDFVRELDASGLP